MTDCYGQFSLLHLPIEIVEIIATHPCLSLTDICRLSNTCTIVHDIVSRSWSHIAQTRWQWWSNQCKSISVTNGWYSLCKERYNCEKQLLILLHKTISRGVRQYLTDDEELECYGHMVSIDSGLCSQDVFECVLLEILNKNIKESNLSYQYYGLCIYEYMRRRDLKRKWKEYFNKQEQLLIEGAILIAEWIDPVKTTIDCIVDKEINNIAQLTAKQLLSVYNEGGVSLSKEGVSLSEGQCTAAQSITDIKLLKIPRNDILKNLNIVMFNHLGYKAASNDYYQLENSLIDKVLDRRRGIPISLSAVYQAVAYKLGVKLLPVNFPAHFLLKTEINHDTGEGEIFVDPFNKGDLLSQSDCLNLVPFFSVTSPDIFKAVKTHRAIMRMVVNIYSRDPFALNFDVGRHWLDCRWTPLVLPSAVSLQLFLCYISPVCDFTSTIAAGAAEIALDLRYNTKQVQWVMSDICDVTSPSVYVLTKLQRSQYAAEKRKKALNEPTRVKARDVNKVIYTVGMIMQHVRYDYRCVIYGWDSSCEMTDQWILQMGVNQLYHGPAQPFYNVLVEDGTNRYAAQESLLPCVPDKLCDIVHWEVGKYFERFTGDRYIPNHALLEKYPN